MPTFKVMTFNTEWMVRLFVKNQARFAAGSDDRAQRIAGVIWDSQADIIGIQEGPPLQSQMERFVRDYLDDAYDVYPGRSRWNQCNHLLVWKDIGLGVTQLPQSHAIYRHLTRKVEYYRWGNVKKDSISREDFTRLPVVVKLDVGGEGVELMVFHTKSKISKLKRKKQYTSRDRDAIVDALRSRQKLSAEMYAIRRYLTHAILGQRTEGCILVGDLNDGPHRDIFEEKFLIHNIVDELRGGFHREEALMHHALPQQAIQPGRKMAFTARFSDPTRDGKMVKVLLDHIMVTTGIRHGGAPLTLVKNSGKIEHDVFESWVSGSKKPSDHRPVSAKFRY